MNSLSRIPPSLAELPLRRKTPLLLGLYEFLLRAEKLKALKSDELAEKTKDYLTKDEVKGVMARRDKIVATFQSLIAEKGEKEVLY